VANATIGNIILELTPREARVLLYICNNIAGDPKDTARNVTDEIGTALINAGVYAPNSTTVRYHDGSFRFLPDSINL